MFVANFRSLQLERLTSDIAERNNAVSFTGHEAHLLRIVIHLKRHRLETLSDDLAGQEHRLHQVLARELSTCGAEVRTFLLSS